MMWTRDRLRGPPAQVHPIGEVVVARTNWKTAGQGVRHLALLRAPTAVVAAVDRVRRVRAEGSGEGLQRQDREGETVE